MYYHTYYLSKPLYYLQFANTQNIRTMAKEISIPSIVLIFDRKKKASDTTTGTVEIRITHNRKQKYLSTGIKLFPRQWKNGRAANMREAGEINMQLDILMSKIRNVVTEMMETGNIDIFDIPRRIKNIQDRTSLINYIHKRAEIRKYGKKNDTAKRYDRFTRMLEQYGGFKTFSDISEQAIMQYDKYLTAKGMTQYSKWQNYHRFLNSFINDAIQDGLIKSNPYRTLHIDKDKTVKSLSRHLTLAEIKKIEKTKMPAESLERTKDVFLFQTYTCLAYTDLKTFNNSKIKTINGMKAYTGNRDKTGKEFVIPLIKQAVHILEKYNYNLPVISNAKYNLYLKSVAQIAGINKPVTSHWARHTGATLLLNSGVPLQTIAKICGHSSVRITEQVYAKLLDETVIKDVKKALDK